MVLLVDDDTDLRDAIADLLRFRGYSVTTAADGRAALDVIGRDVLPCVVLLDLAMPGMDGWTLLAVLRADPLLAKIPVVIASAHAATHAPGGTAGVLPKPFDLDDLFAIVERHCGPPSPPS